MRHTLHYRLLKAIGISCMMREREMKEGESTFVIGGMRDRQTDAN